MLTRGVAVMVVAAMAAGACGRDGDGGAPDDADHGGRRARGQPDHRDPARCPSPHGVDLAVMARDVVVIGGGIAGVSVGYYLSERGLDVLLVEAEPTLAHHTTGRSAAIFLENYGNDVVRRLTVAGRAFLTEPPPQLVDGPVVTPLPVMRVGRPEQIEQLYDSARSAQGLVPTTRYLDAAETLELFPVLRPELVGGSVLEPDAMEMDVAGLHQAFVRGLRANGGAIATSSPVVGLAPAAGGWRVTLPGSSIDCPVVVNAAGAWCDRIAAMAGVEPVGLVPLRRTVCVAALPDGMVADGWPFVVFETPGGGVEDAYCKPEAGGLLVSPADETPSEPCDAKPEEIDVARGLDQVARWTTLELRHVRSAWAGLRSFVADRTMVAGFAPDAPGFFWLAGQGGYGIHTSPGLGRMAAGLVVDGAVPDDLAALGLTAADLAADRPGLRGELVLGE